MSCRDDFLSFCWWNLHHYAHYDACRISDPRWPKSPSHYEGKTERILVALRELYQDRFPDLLAFSEITREAARDLAAGLPGKYNATLSPQYPHDDGFQVAVLYRSDKSFSPELPLIPTETEDVPQGTRPMIPVHCELPGHIIRFMACHWTAFDKPESRVARERLADVLRRDTYEFLEPETPNERATRHVIIVGDFNEEPMSDMFQHRFIARRDRDSCHTRHWRDTDVRRVRLYNAAWRYLGEQVPHGAESDTIGAAGTYFQEPCEWRTYDHVVVSSSLLGPIPPYFDEAHTKVVSTPIMRDGRGRPMPFTSGSASGVSDHFPILGRLILPEASK
jgi:endonuclease/exonuclease/phosphatase family metal-dependent hydrolase